MKFLDLSPDKKYIISTFPWVFEFNIRIYSPSLRLICLYTKHRSFINNVDCNKNYTIVSADDKQIRAWTTDGITKYILNNSYSNSCVNWLNDSTFVYSGLKDNNHVLKYKNIYNEEINKDPSNIYSVDLSIKRHIITKQLGQKIFSIISVRDKFYMLISESCLGVFSGKLHKITIISNVPGKKVVLYELCNFCWADEYIYACNTNEVFKFRIFTDLVTLVLEDVYVADTYVYKAIVDPTNTYMTLNYICKSTPMTIINLETKEIVGSIKERVMDFCWLTPYVIVCDYGDFLSVHKFSTDNWEPENHYSFSNNIKNNIFVLLCIFKYGCLNVLNWDCMYKIIQYYADKFINFRKFNTISTC